MEDTMLLATFVKSRNVGHVINLIRDNFNLVNNQIFLLKDKDFNYKKILTYNVFKDGSIFSDKVRNTISLHRKKESNTLYTLNALNEVIRIQNFGETDNTFTVNWDLYKNSILLLNKTDDGYEELKKINTELIKIIRSR